MLVVVAVVVVFDMVVVVVVVVVVAVALAGAGAVAVAAEFDVILAARDSGFRGGWVTAAFRHSSFQAPWLGAPPPIKTCWGYHEFES